MCRLPGPRRPFVPQLALRPEPFSRARMLQLRASELFIAWPRCAIGFWETGTNFRAGGKKIERSSNPAELEPNRSKPYPLAIPLVLSTGHLCKCPQLVPSSISAPSERCPSWLGFMHRRAGTEARNFVAPAPDRLRLATQPVVLDVCNIPRRPLVAIRPGRDSNLRMPASRPTGSSRADKGERTPFVPRRTRDLCGRSDESLIKRTNTTRRQFYKSVTIKNFTMQHAFFP